MASQEGSESFRVPVELITQMDKTRMTVEAMTRTLRVLNESLEKFALASPSPHGEGLLSRQPLFNLSIV